MSNEAKAADLAVLSGKIGQLIRTNELKMAGKFLATARGHLHQLAEGDRVFQPRYEHIAEIRNELMEPSGEDFDEKQLLVRMWEEEKELHKLAAHHHKCESLLVSQTLLRCAAAIVLVYAQDLAGDAPLDF
jgi:hypothetical protein